MDSDNSYLTYNFLLQMLFLYVNSLYLSQAYSTVNASTNEKIARSQLPRRGTVISTNKTWRDFVLLLANIVVSFHLFQEMPFYFLIVIQRKQNLIARKILAKFHLSPFSNSFKSILFSKVALQWQLHFDFQGALFSLPQHSSGISRLNSFPGRFLRLVTGHEFVGDRDGCPYCLAACQCMDVFSQ